METNIPEDMLGLSSSAFKQLVAKLDPGKGLYDLMWKGHRTELEIYTIPKIKKWATFSRNLRC